MADLPEDGGWVEGVRAIEETDPVRFDVYNESLSALASRTKYLQENSGSGSGTGAPIEWLDGDASVNPASDHGVPLLIGLLEPGKHYILDNRVNAFHGIIVYPDNAKEAIESFYECITGGDPMNLKDIPVGSEFHFTLAGDPDGYGMWIDWFENWGGPMEDVQ